ncbi:IS1634 family transposase [Fodinisporobacter ferrooxydans]|uniref:IS1634 family transposase n=1 Tax=Fodinisporobacter ferrooxydans TaxID=2901836 RepID=A0ABY4CPV6_9BACL|nr:IS1634 family transposase [Alicyclobacillaceae bacterium MYW30-H2]UOF91950.1 IS1634 family transposase [Alicyclobacillaceae bacterium MYW30-H2]
MNLSDLHIEVRMAKSAPIVAGLCADLQIASIIDRFVEWDPHRTKVSPGIRIVALIVNFLVQRKPLYKIERFYANMDCEWLFGQGFLADELNDDRLAAALDKLADADPWRIYHEIALGTPEAQFDTFDRLLHFDTTSISVQGSYEDSELEDSPLKIVRGYSKDLRADLKQFMYGLGSIGGIPLFADVMNGNTSDKPWYSDLTGRIDRLLSPEAWNSIVVVADSAFVTEENLQTYEKRSFISRLPDTYNLCKQLKDRAFQQEEQFVDLGVLGSARKNSATYRIQSFKEELYERAYRFVVVQTSHLDERKAKRLMKQIADEAEQLTKEIEKQQAIEFHCEPDATVALTQFLHDHKAKFHQINGHVQSEKVVKRRRGRPSKNNTYGQLVEKDIWRICIQFNQDDETIARTKQREGTFVLISNVDKSNKSDEKLVTDYKSQIQVENLFRAVKHPFLMYGIFLKNPKRVQAMAYVFLFALLVYAILQQRIRRGLDTESQPLILNGVKILSPTGWTILEEFENVTHIIVRLPDGQTHHRLDGITEGAIRILRWLQLQRKSLLTAAGLQEPTG